MQAIQNHEYSQFYCSEFVNNVSEKRISGILRFFVGNVIYVFISFFYVFLRISKHIQISQKKIYGKQQRFINGITLFLQ